MRKTIPLIACVVAVVAWGCNRLGTRPGTSTATDTIAPAAAKPAPTSSDDAVNTQTVDIEDSRTEAEGGAGYQPAPGTQTTVAVRRKSGAAAGARKKPPSPSRPPGRKQ